MSAFCRAGGTAPAAPARAGAIFSRIFLICGNAFLFERANPQLNRITFLACTRKAQCSSEQVPIEVDGHNEDLFLPVLGDKPKHPKTFTFPKQKFGNKKPTYRSFQSSWLDKWPWITYSETDDNAFCFVCIKAVQQERVRNCSLTSKTSDAFLTRGYTNWKDAMPFLFTNAPAFSTSNEERRKMFGCFELENI